MALSVRPRTIEPGEWVAHQVVEHYRILWNFVRVVHEKEADGDSICNPASCPKMSAGSGVSYTWLNVDQEPVELPAHECMKLLQQWMSAKIEDGAVFPTDPSDVSSAYSSQHSTNTGPSRSVENWLGICSGFPERFAVTCKVMFR
ncbi:hypothetical protein G6O67_008613 [Ophiocordyceps sinensis]|nr:hypothetical protein G6O67_008613 [Ophiocordyceps sinensis]